jgi:uncharacterized repeat protein (TIGR01451 family)
VEDDLDKDSDDDNNTSTPDTNIKVDKDDGVENIVPGDGVTHTYNITITNSGPSDEFDVDIDDTFPAGITVSSVTPTEFDGANITTSNTDLTKIDDIADMPAGSTIEYLVNYTVNSEFTGDWINNTASAFGQFSNDTDDDNNTVSKQKITIIKDVPNGSTQDFNFTSNVPNHEEFILEDDEDLVDASAAINDLGDFPNNENMTDIAPGIYTIYEIIPDEQKPFWQLADVRCVVKDIETGEVLDEYQSTWQFDAETDSVEINLAAGEDVICTFTNIDGFAQRTQGFYKTHTEITNNTFQNPLGSAEVIGFTEGTIVVGSSTTGQVIDDIREVFGLYYAANAWYADKKYNDPKSDGTPRTAEEQQYMLMIHQLLTAKLNCGIFGCGELVEDLIQECDDLYASQDLDGLNNVTNPDLDFFTGDSCTEKLDWYNNLHGDGGSNKTFEEQFGVPPGASPSASKALAEDELPEGDLHQNTAVNITGIARWDNVIPSDDFDGDGLTNYEETAIYLTNPLLADTDGDGLSDELEVNVYPTDPLQNDTDSDGLSDGVEITIVSTNATDDDTDNDGILDGNEDINANGIVEPTETSPLAIDTDGDGLQDGTEIGLAAPQGSDTSLVFIPDADSGSTTTNPTLQNTDGDACALDGTDEDFNLNGIKDDVETTDASIIDCF